MSSEELVVEDAIDFLHDLASPLSILRLHLRRLMKSANEPGEKIDPVKFQKVMDQMLSAIEKMEKLHSDFKEKIVNAKAS